MKWQKGPIYGLVGTRKRSLVPFGLETHTRLYLSVAAISTQYAREALPDPQISLTKWRFFTTCTAMQQFMAYYISFPKRLWWPMHTSTRARGCGIRAIHKTPYAREGAAALKKKLRNIQWQEKVAQGPVLGVQPVAATE